MLDLTLKMETCFLQKLFIICLQTPRSNIKDPTQVTQRGRDAASQTDRNYVVKEKVNRMFDTFRHDSLANVTRGPNSRLTFLSAEQFAC